MTTETFYAMVRGTHDVQAAVFRAFAAWATANEPLYRGAMRRAADQAEALVYELRRLVVGECRQAVAAQAGPAPWEEGDGTAGAVETGDIEE